MTQPQAAQLGFGTGNLYGGNERSRSLALLRAALEAGIRWIDTAPLYGHGAAEHIVGEAIAGRRDELILVSKVGILPSKMTLGYRLHAKAAGLMGKLPRGESLLQPPAPRRPQFRVFAPPDVRASVERSLVALGTDRLDVLLLHEVDPQTAASPALIETLEGLVTEGKILGFGVATQADQTLLIAASPTGAKFSLFQTPATGSEQLRVHAGAGIVLHSLLGPPLKLALGRLKENEASRELARGLNIDPDRPDLGRRLVAHALGRRQARAALFSTRDTVRIAHMAEVTSLSAQAAEAGFKLMAGILAQD